MGRAEAIILAAGRGERMRPLTDATPKPLLRVRGRPLIEWHLDALARSGVRSVVINTAWLEERIPEALGDGSRWGLSISYSMEGRDHGGALETAGGIAKALPLLAECFWVVAGDVFVPGFAFTEAALRRCEAGARLAHIFLVPNPAHNPRGDFGVSGDGHALSEAPQRYTYSTIGIYKHAFFAALPAGNPQGVKAPLAPMLRAGMDRGEVSAEVYGGEWTDVGTPQRLEELNNNRRTPP